MILCECGCGSPLKIAKKKSKQTRFIYGHQHAARDYTKSRKPMEQCFWEKVEKTDSCWVWHGAKNDKGYGQLRNYAGIIYAHRFSYALHKGEIPKGRKLLHRCDNPLCVNPDHLTVGRQVDNIHDAMNKGRMAGNPQSDSNVIAIRELYKAGKYTQKSLATMFNTHQSNISYIVNMKTRREVCC